MEQFTHIYIATVMHDGETAESNSPFPNVAQSMDDILTGIRESAEFHRLTTRTLHDGLHEIEVEFDQGESVCKTFFVRRSHGPID